MPSHFYVFSKRLCFSMFSPDPNNPNNPNKVARICESCHFQYAFRFSAVSREIWWFEFAKKVNIIRIIVFTPSFTPPGEWCSLLLLTLRAVPLDGIPLVLSAPDLRRIDSWQEVLRKDMCFEWSDISDFLQCHSLLD
jgi:hypothetical protein